ncbi:MAG TPA: hypothetical protein VJP45_12265 [Candidatus Limnocylindria bacterium]|nr:hypothetical protein [Candidatus Limnocylindria bacterium]
MDALLDPPFAKDPPLKLDIPAKTLGLVLAILGGIGTVLGVLALIGVGAFAAAIGGGLLFIGTLVQLVGTALGAWGAYRMYQEDRGGKRLVIYSLVINAVGGLISVLAGTGLGGWIVNTLLAVGIYYLVIISRFEGEPKLVGATAPRRPEQP